MRASAAILILALTLTLAVGPGGEASAETRRLETVAAVPLGPAAPAGVAPRDAAIRTIWNGVPYEPVVPDGSFRRSVGGAGRVLIGTIATLIPQKGLSDLLKVARRVSDMDGRVLFVIVGEGALRPELEALRDELGLGDSVVFAGWVTNASKVALPEFDVFFQPSLWEAMSIAVLEAMCRSS